MTQAFNLSQFANKVNSSGQADLTTSVTGALPVANGGTNQTTYTNGQLLIGNSTGNTLTKSTLTAGSGVTITNGAGSITIASAAGNLQTEIYTSPATWTCPTTTNKVRVMVVGGGGGGGSYTSPSISGRTGGRGGFAWAEVPVSAPVTITVGAGGAGAANAPNGVSGGAGGTSSFGPAISATGGSGGNPAVTSTDGTGTVSSGTTIKAGTFNSVVGNNTPIGLISGSVVVSTAAPAAITYAVSGPNAPFLAGSPGPGAPIGIAGSTGTGGVSGVVILEYIA